jgi:hypothetical protein
MPQERQTLSNFSFVVAVLDDPKATTPCDFLFLCSAVVGGQLIQPRNYLFCRYKLAALHIPRQAGVSVWMTQYLGFVQAAVDCYRNNSPLAKRVSFNRPSQHGVGSRKAHNICFVGQRRPTVGRTNHHS